MIRKISAPFGICAYWVLLTRFSAFNTGHLVVGLLAIALVWGGERFSKLRALILPLLLTAIVYDSQRLYSDLLRGPIHVAEPYFFDRNFFGILSDGIVLTPNEWWQRHTHSILDFFCGIAYLTFIPEFFLVVAYFLFRGGHEESRLAKQMAKGFFWLNVFGYSTYYWYAAAPPWYVAGHGLGAAQLSTAPSLAGCIRFDQIVGLPIFKTWYGHSADVFGAIPSLHVAYPLLAVFYAFRIGRLRAWSIVFYAWVSFSAVYLNHHYILDILWGSAYALIIGASYWLKDNAGGMAVEGSRRENPRLLTNPLEQEFS